MSVRKLPEKADESMLVTDAGMQIDTSDQHLENSLEENISTVASASNVTS
jgi:hypothetical protein